MTEVFADTFYFIALLNTEDPAHERAIMASLEHGRRFVTSEAVMTELGDALNNPGDREDFNALMQMVRKDAAWELVPSSRELFRAGHDIFRRHRDKSWQMTDCISFAAMRQRHIKAALTGDAHFVQAGFVALLR